MEKPSKGFCKKRPGSSVGRAADRKSAARRFNSIPGRHFLAFFSCPINTFFPGLDLAIIITSQEMDESYRKEGVMSGREKIWGMDGEVGWTPVLPASGLEGLQVQGDWVRSGDAVEATAGEHRAAWIKIGGAEWRDYELKVGVTPLSGGNVQIAFRLSDTGNQHYLLDFLLGWQAVAISKVDHAPGGRGLVKLSVVNFELRHGTEYMVELAARGASLTSYIEGKLINQVTDFDFPSGGLELSVWNARTKFRDPKARRLA